MLEWSVLSASAAIIAVSSAVVAGLLIKKFTRPKEFSQLPSPPQSSWLFGHMMDTKGSYARWKKDLKFPEPQLSWRKKYGGVIYTRDFLRHGLAISDPKAIQHILIANANNYPRHPALANYFEEAFFGVGLLSSHGAQHDQFRKILNPLFSAQNIKSFIGLFESHARKYSDKLAKASETNEPLNMIQVFQHLTLEVIGLAAFGYNFMENETGKKAYNEFHMELNPLLFLLMLNFPKFTSKLPLSSLKRRREAHLKLKQIVLDVIEQKLKKEGSSDEPKDLLDLILPHSTNAEAIVHTMTFMTGGHETSASTLAWVFLTLSSRPDVVASIRKEHAEVVAKYGSLSSWEAVSELNYTLAVINETLRLNTVAFVVTRVAQDDGTLPLMDGSTVSVPKDTSIALLVSATNLSEDYWHKPDQFIPERFIEGSSAWKEDMKLREPYNHKLYFFPFSNGSKNCIGQRFALAEMQVITATFLSRFNFEATENTDGRHNFTGIVAAPLKLEMKVSRVAPAA